MNTTKQICWYCEGSVSSEALQCCFCGSELAHENNLVPVETTITSPDLPREPEIVVETPLDESLACLYKPPYLIRERFTPAIPIKKVESTDQSATELTDRFGEDEISHVPNGASEMENGDALSLLLLSLGAFLLTLGLLLFFFAEEGSVTLQWNTNYWFIYCFLALPALYFGFRYLGKIQEK